MWLLVSAFDTRFWHNTPQLTFHHHANWQQGDVRLSSTFIKDATLDSVNWLFLPGVAYMRQWKVSSLVQIMACRLFGAKPLSKQIIVNCALRNKIQWNISQISNFSIQENAFENVVSEMVAILSSGRRVDAMLSRIGFQTVRCWVVTELIFATTFQWIWCAYLNG